MPETVLVIDDSVERRRLLRAAVERRGMRVTGEAGSVSEVVDMIAGLDAAPSTVLVGSVPSSQKLASIVKRAFPRALVLEQYPASLRLASGV